MSKSKRRLGHFSRCTRFESLEQRIVLDSQIGAVTMPYDGFLSAAIYDSNGQVVRTLLARSPQEQGVSVPLLWDGKDDVGRPVMSDGTFTWKALTSQVEAVDEGGVGDSLYDPSHRYLVGEPGNYGEVPFDFTTALVNVAADPSGNWYYTGHGVENGNQNQMFAQDGTVLATSGNLIDGAGIASDGTYVYITGKSGTNDAIIKYNFTTKTFASFTSAGSSIIVNSNTVDPRPAGQDRYTVSEFRQKYSTLGIAVDNNGRIFVTNYKLNRVEVYDKVTGSKLDEFSVTAPLGIAVETSGASSGTIWVTNSGYQVSRYNFTVSGSYSFTEDISRRIQGLNDPSGVAIGGPSNHLYVAVTGDGQVREYNIASTPALAGMEIFGTKHIGGNVGDHDFSWVHSAGVAVDSSGILTVTDDHRIQRFYTVTGGGHTAGELKQSVYGVFEATPRDTFGYTSDGKYFLTSSVDTWEIDSTWTGGPRAGWLGDGTWRLAQRDVMPNPIEDNQITLHRVLSNGREYHYLIGNQGVQVLAADPSTGALRHSSELQGLWYGYDHIQQATPGGRFFWADTDGDGITEESEITHTTPFGTQSQFGYGWVADNGDIWGGDGITKSIVKIPLAGFDAQNNPIYSWASMQTIIPFLDDDVDFFPAQVFPLPNGEIYAMGHATALSGFFQGANPFLPGADWVAKYNSSGQRVLLNRTPTTHISGLSVDETDPTGAYYYTSHADHDEAYGFMYTSDGLQVAKARPREASAYSNGWADIAWAINAFTHPFTGKTYMYIAESSTGQAERYRIDNLGTIQRTQGNFNWTYSTDLTARWKFDDTLQDSISHNDGTFFGGSPSYVYGPQGKALSFDGVDDRVEMLNTTSRLAYTISAWVKPTDTTNVNIIARTLAGGQVLDQLRINNNGQFEHSTFDNSGAHTITSTIVAQPGTWYHVVGVAQVNGMMRLYINGQEEGTAQSIGTLTAGTDRFHVGDATFGVGAFTGLIDDIRVSDQPLRATDVRALYDEVAAERDGYWALDSNLNDSAGTNNGSFVGGAPSYVTGMYGQAINFDGVDDLVSLPYATDPESYTISAWVKPTDTTSVSILTRTSASGPATDFFDQLRINSSGQFEHFTNDGTGHTVIGTTVAQPGVWYHVVGTATGGGKMRLYVNGKEEGLAQSIGALSTAGDRFYVGSNSGGGMGYFQGLIDDVRVYNEVASALDVEDLFHNGDALDYKGLWAFENNVNDSAGSNNGTFNGGAAVYATGKIGNAIDLDGSNDFVNIPYATDPTAYTISAWVRPTDVTSVNIINRTDASGPSSSYSHEIGINSTGKFQHYNFTPDGNMLVTGTTSAVSNTWYHVAAVAQTNGMMRLYVNGKEEGTAVAIGSLLTSGDRFHVGNAGGGFGFGFFDGLVDDLRIYERALSVDEIDSIYDGKGAADVTNIPPTVTVVATDNKAAETGSDPGTFTITRDHSVGNLVVNYAMSGVAVNGSDYSSLSGSVTILSGQSSVTVTVTPIDDPSNDPSETVIITLTGGSYTVGTPSSATVMIADNEATGDIAWTGSNNTPNGTNGNNYGWSYNTNEANGTTGEIGGTFAKAQLDSYYADTNLSSALNLANTISGSGKFDIPSITSGWGAGGSGLFIGHFSQDPASREFIGLEFQQNGTGSMLARARMQVPVLGGADSSWIAVAVNGNHTFSYTYDPSLGANGRLTLVVDSQPALVVDLSDGERATGVRFDAFGMGYTNNLNSETDQTKTAQVFMDDLTYTGFQAGVLPPAVTVSASDPSAAEVGANTGTFTVTRVGTSGNLTVNYTVSGTAVSGTDYSALSGSVIIPNGQSSANFTVTPIDDNVVEPSKEVVVTLSSSVNYTLGVPKSAGVTIADNEPTVIITATDASGAEVGPDTGTFTIIRGGTSGNLTVNYTVSGTATSGSDFSVLSGSVVIPNGQTSATVTVTPINDSATEGGETVTLEVASGTGYAVGSTNRATMTISDNDAQGNPGWTGSNNTLFGNNFGWSDTTKEAGGVHGEIGGTFARTAGSSFFGDTSLSSTFTANNTITGSGKFSIFNNPGWGLDGSSGIFVGHFTQSTSNFDFVGLQIREWREDAARVVARFGGIESPKLVLGDGEHTFSYTYDPNLGAFGRLTLNVDTLPSMILDLDMSTRTSGTVFNAFGMGAEGFYSSENNPTKVAQAFIDDLNYSGRQTAGLPSVMVDATDASAAEPGSNTGVFTVTRTGTSGNLTVNYTVAGSAGSGTDYSALAGSVIIPNGQSSANITVTPLDDLVAESNKTVVLTLSTSANYYLTNSTSAIVTIADNEPTVTVTASDSIAQEQGLDTGTYTFTRTNSSGNLTVFYTMSGSATAPDYAALPGSVTIPNGQTSATVTITPVDDPSPESSEFAILTISANSAYFTGSPNSATVTIVDNDTLSGINFDKNPGWTGSNRTNLGNNYGWSPATSQAGGTTGEAGGTFARAQADSYYADTLLSQTFNLNNTISAAGKFDALGITSGWADVAGDSGLFIGHFSRGASNKEFIGLELKEDPSGLTSQLQVRARLQLPGGAGTAFSGWVNVSTNGNHTFSYTYNPALGANGRLTLNIDALSPLTVDLSAGDRTSGSAFDAFGLGYTSNLNSENAPAKTAQVFIDDVSYSGYQPAVTVAPSDSNIAEAGNNTATFKLTRTNANGNLVVNYLATGVVTAGTDYSALAGSVTILHGQTSATVTVMPLDDIALESNEPVVLTLVSGSGYHLGTTYSAAVTITDNDSIVTVTATDASASETGPDAGVYTFTRTGSSGNLVVNYTMGGTATNSSDYSALTGAVTIPNGQTSVTVTLTPIDDLVGEGSETAILTLTSNAAYTIGLSNTASVTIADNEPTVTLNVTDASAAETGANPATFMVTRNNSIGNLTVNYTLSGTAVNGSDYSSLSGSVTIPNGQSSAVVTVTPIDDPTGEGSETVTLTLATGAYFIGSPNTDNATIADNDNVNVDFSLNPGWTGSGNTTSGNSYGYSPTTGNAGGATGEVGGTFARNIGESYFADTHLSTTYNLNNLITASGKVTVFGQSNMDGELFLGHMSSNTLDGSGVGIEILENNSGSVRMRARMVSPGGDTDGATASTNLVVPNGDYSFTYTYDPNLGTDGRLTVRIFNGSYDQTSTVDLSNGDRTGGATFNSFGLGIIRGVAADNDASRTVQVFIDDVSYTGYQAPFAVDGFESGNGTGGTGWGGVWSFSGAATVTNSGTPANGGFHLQVTGNGAIASRAVSLAGAASARLVFDWKANSFEPGETAVVEAFDGTTWINMLTISDGQDDNVYHHADITLSAAFFTSSFQVRVRSLMSAADDFVYIDDLRIAR